MSLYNGLVKAPMVPNPKIVIGRDGNPVDFPAYSDPDAGRIVMYGELAGRQVPTLPPDPYRAPRGGWKGWGLRGCAPCGLLGGYYGDGGEWPMALPSPQHGYLKTLIVGGALLLLAPKGVIKRLGGAIVGSQLGFSLGAVSKCGENTGPAYTGMALGGYVGWRMAK